MSERLALPSHFNFVNESPGSVSPFFVVSHCCWVPADDVVASDSAHARVLMQLPSYNSPETILVHHPTIFHHGTNHLPFFSIHLSRPLQNITSIYQNHDFVYCKIYFIGSFYYLTATTTRLVDLVNTDTWPSLADSPRIRTTFRQLSHVWAARQPPTIVLVRCYFRMSRRTPRGGRNGSPKELVS